MDALRAVAIEAAICSNDTVYIQSLKHRIKETESILAILKRNLLKLEERSTNNENNL